MRVIVNVVLALLIAGSSAATQPFIDKGACPGEGCRYGERWVSRSSVDLRKAPDSSSALATTVAPGETVFTLTGEVHTIPGRFIVQRSFGAFSPGDEVLVFTYLGEGRFRILHNGKLEDADLGFSPWGGTAGTRCELDPRCWGTLESELEFQWWVKVRTSGGLEGWVLGDESFDRPID